MLSAPSWRCSRTGFTGSLSNDRIKQAELCVMVDERVCFSVFINYHQRGIKKVRIRDRRLGSILYLFLQ